MGIQTWTFIIVGITFTLYIGIAIWSRAASTKEFYIAGGGVSPLGQRVGHGGRLDVRCFLFGHGRYYCLFGL